MTNSDYILMMREAKHALSGNWLNAALATLIVCLLISLSSITYIAELLLYGPLTFGLYIYMMCLTDTRRNDLNLLFIGFNRFVDTMVAGLLLSLAISIGCALLIVPGIILGCGFSMTFFILADDKNISGVDALKKSWELTTGHKMDVFMLNIRFFGWILLAMLSCGIGFLWLIPYMINTNLNLYRRLHFGSAI